MELSSTLIEKLEEAKRGKLAADAVLVKAKQDICDEAEHLYKAAGISAGDYVLIDSHIKAHFRGFGLDRNGTFVLKLSRKTINGGVSSIVNHLFFNPKDLPDIKKL